jgi:hypothetical protein
MPNAPLPKMMLGFVIRRCAVAVGHEPSPAEFARWANAYPDGKRTVHLFGRPITEREAQVILRHRGRPVAARTASPDEELRPELEILPGKVASLEGARARLLARRRRAPHGRR